MMKEIKVALAGLGGRGLDMMRRATQFDGVKIVAVCDTFAPKKQKYLDFCKENNLEVAEIYDDYKEMIDTACPDAVMIITSWDVHVEQSLYAMEKGVAVACEVCSGYSIEQAWDLVRCYERTKTPIMFLENCCYGKLELLALNMKRAGVLGEIVHCEGGYCHYLSHEITGGADGSHYRYEQYKHRNCDNYPTHEIGPIAKLLDINCGNRFVSLYSMASKSVGLKEYVKENQLHHLECVEFKQGDVITTLIKCANGETVKIALDTTIPRYYSRGFTVEGTKGMLCEDTDAVYLKEDVAITHLRKEYLGSVEKYYEKYGHKLWKNDVKKDGHGGIDYMVLGAFFDALKSGKPMPIDVYDMATWISVSTLSEQSIATGQAVAFPDFTNGKWIKAKNNFLVDED
ncbi:MAG: Gfo/Idh/MocA family oxidoreductase [Clostridia bacterium]|nr:Gfo/Idh/MocA family oxidoreductase [Clostridia bacterium]